MIKIYLTDLACYNEGELRGSWLELPIDEEELQEKINEVLKKGHEEYFITDYEAPFPISEHEDIFNLNEQMEELQDLQDNNFIDDDIIELFFKPFDTLEEVITELENGGYRIYKDVQDASDICYQDFENGLLGEMNNEYLSQYIDFNSMGNDREMNSTIVFGDNIAIEFIN